MENDLVKEATQKYLLPGLVAYVLGTCECDYCKMIKAIKNNKPIEEEFDSDNGY